MVGKKTAAAKPVEAREEPVNTEKLAATASKSVAKKAVYKSVRRNDGPVVAEKKSVRRT